MLDVQHSTFFSNQGRVAESGLRHSTRNRAWGNPPWVRIPPLPPCLAVLSVNNSKKRCEDAPHSKSTACKILQEARILFRESFWSAMRPRVAFENKTR